MNTKIKTSLLDIVTGLITSVVLNYFSRYIYFSYVSSTIITALIFLLIGILRGSSRVIPVLLKVVFINIFTLTSIIIAPLPLALFLPIPLVAVIFTFIGIYVRLKWTSEMKMKNAACAIVSLALVSILSIILYPRHISNFYTQKFNKPASEFEFISFEGDSIKSKDIKGNVILLDFWESGCGPCIAAMPD